MKYCHFTFIALLAISLTGFTAVPKNYCIKTEGDGPLPVPKCNDFMINGSGDNVEWNKTIWTKLIKLDSGGRNYQTKFKVLYSAKGIYLLFSGEDERITTKFDKDFQDLFKGDVFEVFFHPDTTMPLYLEYEINALNKELVLLVPHFKDRIFGWIPWHYEKERIVKKLVHIDGGNSEAGASIKSWTAELFFPYSLFKPLNNVPPTSGTQWNANFYRLDYDSGQMIKWAWTPIDRSFHEFEKYHAIRFE